MSDSNTTEAGSREAIKEARPLSATQTKNLQQILQGDYKKLHSQIAIRGAEKIAEKTRELRQAASDVEGEKLRKKAQKVHSKYVEDMAALNTEARVNGFQIGWANGAGGICTVQNTGLAQKIKDMTSEVNAEVMAAREVANQAYLDSERVVLLASISGLAENVLSSIPTPDALMLQAAQERADKIAAKELR